MEANIETSLLGRTLYGDNFNTEEIQKWYQDESEGYANLGARNAADYKYQYHALNNLHGYRYLPKQVFQHVVSIGGAYGDELKPVLGRTKYITMLEPSEALAQRESIDGIPCSYVKPCPSGDIPIDSESVDLVTCHGVLHHIPNVSHVVSECYRVLKYGGKMLLREPTVSMGDWRIPRPGLTKRERGIPEEILDSIIRENGFHLINRAYCVFSPLTLVMKKVGLSPFNNRLACCFDAMLSRLFSFNMVYHRVTLADKFSPASVYYVIEK